MIPCEVCGADVDVFDEEGCSDDYRWYICPTCGWTKRKKRLNIDKIIKAPEKTR